MDIKAWGINKITRGLEPINWPAEKARFPHLQDLPLASISSSPPDILLGMDFAYLHAHLQTRVGKPHEPYAAETVLGWIALGEVSNVGKRDQGQVTEFSRETDGWQVVCSRQRCHWQRGGHLGLGDQEAKCNISRECTSVDCNARLQVFPCYLQALLPLLQAPGSAIFYRLHYSTGSRF